MLRQKNIIYIFITSCIITILFFKTQAMANSPSPTQSIKISVDDVIMLLKTPEYKNTATRLSIRNKIEAEVRKIFDFNEFSPRTLGKNWPSFTDEQKKQFNDAFSNLLLATYLDKVDGYHGEKISYNGENISNNGDRAEVKTMLNLTDGRTIPIIYRMMSKNNSWFVYDVIIENISLIKNYRSQFQDLLIKGSPEALIKRVQERAVELRNSSLNNTSQ